VQYEPIKGSLSSVIKGSPLLRRGFYLAMHAFFLREWFVKREIRRVFRSKRIFNILDAGSGFGQYSLFMTRKNHQAQIIGLDIKPTEIAECNNFFFKSGYRNARFSFGDLTELTIADEYDFILSVDVMEHIEHDEAVFGNFYRALKSGGTLLVNTPSDQGGSDHDDESGEGFIDEHFRDGYSVEDIRAKLERAGLTVKKIYYTYGFWGNLYWRLIIKVPMQVLGVSKLFFVLLPFYYVVFYPIGWLFMVLDYLLPIRKGTGLVAVAEKS
jgi:SAM-dependent methyltransferase